MTTKSRKQSFAGFVFVVSSGLFCTTAIADVLVIGANGFENYDNGSRLVVFGSTLAPDPRVSTASAPPSTPSPNVSVPRARIPPTDILDAINTVAMRYASDRAIANAGMTTTEWATFFRSNIQIESAFDPNARSHVGAIGLGQLMPATARALGVDPDDMHQNLDGSARYLLSMLRQFGSMELALAAYNAGPNAVERYGGIPPFDETQGHVVKVMAVFNETIGY